MVNQRVLWLGLLGVLAVLIIGCEEEINDARGSSGSPDLTPSADPEAVYKEVCDFLTLEEVSSACGFNFVETETIRVPQSDLMYQCHYKSIDDEFGGLYDAFYLILADDTPNLRKYRVNVRDYHVVGERIQIEGLEKIQIEGLEIYADRIFLQSGTFHNGYYIGIIPVFNCPKVIEDDSKKAELLKKVIDRLG